MQPDLPGAYEQHPDGGYYCAECAEQIEVGSNVIRADYAIVSEDNFGPHTDTINFGGIYHEDCYER